MYLWHWDNLIAFTPQHGHRQIKVQAIKTTWYLKLEVSPQDCMHYMYCFELTVLAGSGPFLVTQFTKQLITEVNAFSTEEKNI